MGDVINFPVNNRTAEGRKESFKKMLHYANGLEEIVDQGEAEVIACSGLKERNGWIVRVQGPDGRVFELAMRLLESAEEA